MQRHNLDTESALIQQILPFSTTLVVASGINGVCSFASWPIEIWLPFSAISSLLKGLLLAFIISTIVASRQIPINRPQMALIKDQKAELF